MSKNRTTVSRISRHGYVDVSVPIDETKLGKLIVFGGVREFPMRVKCATLCWHAMKSAINGEDDTVTTE